MNTAEKIREVFEINHVGFGFAPVSALIDAGFEYEVAHLVDAKAISSREAMRDFMDNKLPQDRMGDLQVCIDSIAFMVGKSVTDINGTHALFEDGSALSPAGTGRWWLWNPVENFEPSTDRFFYDHD